MSEQHILRSCRFGTRKARELSLAAAWPFWIACFASHAWAQAAEGGSVSSQSAPPSLGAVTEQVARLAAAVEQQQAQLQNSQLEIVALRQQVVSLQEQLVVAHAAGQAATAADEAASLTEQVATLREQQEIQASELATHEQSKVESESRYPVKLTGLILANAFNNSSGVDVIQSPALAVPGSGSSGVSLRQTVLGLDARGPHLAGAATHADVRVDFFGGSAATSAGGYSAAGGLLRLRTAHATVDWTHAQLFAELDRPIVSPDTPSSLTAIAQPALAWSGNLWNWIPQFGGEYRLPLNSRSGMDLRAALVDVPDPPAYATGVNTGSSLDAASYAEQSRWPGSEAHLAYTHGDAASGARLGAGGYFSPHEAKGYFHYDAWAATLDYQLPLGRRLEANGAFYRGLALGGLGGGAYKDNTYSLSPSGRYSFERPLDAVGGWSQLKARAGQRLEFNADFGLDEAFARELRPYAPAGSVTYANLVRNATFFGNAIYSPTAYTLFSFEYRRPTSTSVAGARSASSVYGLAAGYRF